MKQFKISGREAGQRMDKYLFRLMDGSTAGFIYKMLRKKNIVLNGKKAAGSEILSTGDEIKLFLSDETFRKFAPGYFKEKKAESSDVDIVYEDADILIINKPAGLLSQKAGPEDDSANDRIIAYLMESGQMSEADLKTFHPSICNRLDRNTSGLLIAGKTIKGLQKASEELRSRSVKKYYLALVKGRVCRSEHLFAYLVKDKSTNQVAVNEAGPGEPVETAYRPLKSFGDSTLLEVQLITGKTHQIRAQLAAVGHPVLGDPKYGDAEVNRRLKAATGIKSQLLHAVRIEFSDGSVVEAGVPETFSKAEGYLSSWVEK
ncbi:MAG: RluA family pseudouridine synthase [Clostridiales bacterium]|nr:RluA family pseudouridine synthase [Clostridiales bacterium]